MRDGHVRVLPIAVANKIAAGEVVERPASVVKELVENAIDAGAKTVKVAISQGGRRLVSVQDDGCGMSRDDAVLSLERQATSKILDVEDIEMIDTLGFRGEAIPSIASVSRFSLTTRRRDSDEGTFLQVNAGTLAEVRSAGCPPGTLVEVRDLFCNVPARRKFLRSYATEESHVRSVVAVHALAHPSVGFTLVSDDREVFRLAPAASPADRVLDLFGLEFFERMLQIPKAERRDGEAGSAVSVSGFVEMPNLSTPTRREQFVFVNGRPATSPSIAYALKEAYPRRPGDVRPAVILFIELPPNQVDVNVHPTKREVRFRDNVAVRKAICDAVEATLSAKNGSETAEENDIRKATEDSRRATDDSRKATDDIRKLPVPEAPRPSPPPVEPVPVQPEIHLEVSSDGATSKPWRWFKFLAQSEGGYVIVETDEGIVTINPVAARERITYEKLLSSMGGATSQALLIPDVVRLTPVEAARIGECLPLIREMGFQVEAFGRDTFKIDAVPQLLGTSVSSSAILSTVAHDFSECGGHRRGGAKWREELIAKSISRTFAGASAKLDAESATRLVQELCQCRMPYVCPRGKPVMIFTSYRELDRQFYKR